jgi:hypothetical protein
MQTNLLVPVFGIEDRIILSVLSHYVTIYHGLEVNALAPCRRLVASQRTYRNSDYVLRIVDSVQPLSYHLGRAQRSTGQSPRYFRTSDSTPHITSATTFTDINQKVINGTLGDNASVAELSKRQSSFAGESELPAALRSRGLGFFTTALTRCVARV